MENGNQNRRPYIRCSYCGSRFFLAMTLEECRQDSVSFLLEDGTLFKDDKAAAPMEILGFEPVITHLQCINCKRGYEGKELERLQGKSNEHEHEL